MATVKLEELEPDTKYYISLRAHNSIGLSKPLEILVKTSVGPLETQLVVRSNDIQNIIIVLLIIVIVIFYCFCRHNETWNCLHNEK